MKQVNISGQGGFSLTELVIAMAVLALLIGGAMMGLNQMDTARISNSETMIVEKIRSGATQYMARRKSLSGFDKTYLTNTVGLSGDTPWGSAWTISVSGNTVTVNWPVDSASNCAELASGLTGSVYSFITTDATCGGAGNATMTLAFAVR